MRKNLKLLMPSIFFVLTFLVLQKSDCMESIDQKRNEIINLRISMIDDSIEKYKSLKDRDMNLLKLRNIAEGIGIIYLRSYNIDCSDRSLADVMLGSYVSTHSKISDQINLLTGGDSGTRLGRDPTRKDIENVHKTLIYILQEDILKSLNIYRSVRGGQHQKENEFLYAYRDGYIPNW